MSNLFLPSEEFTQPKVNNGVETIYRSLWHVSLFSNEDKKYNIFIALSIIIPIRNKQINNILELTIRITFGASFWYVLNVQIFSKITIIKIGNNRLINFSAFPWSSHSYFRFSFIIPIPAPVWDIFFKKFKLVLYDYVFSSHCAYLVLWSWTR